MLSSEILTLCCKVLSFFFVQGYKPPDEGPSEYQSIPLNKIEDFGVHCKQWVKFVNFTFTCYATLLREFFSCTIRIAKVKIKALWPVVGNKFISVVLFVVKHAMQLHK